MDELEVLARQLRRHTMRRRHGTPTISVLVGDVVSGLLRFERLLDGALGRMVVTRSAPYGAMAEAWLRAMERSLDLPRMALSRAVGSAAEETWAAWQARSPAQRRMWLAELRDHSERPDGRAAAAWLLEHGDDGTPPRDGASALRALLTWLALEEWPAMCVQVDDAPGLDELTQLCLLAPSLPIAAVVATDVWREGLALLTPRGRALLLEGVIETARPPAPDRPLPTPTPYPVVVNPLEVLRHQARNARTQATRALEGAREDAAQLDERARSLAELLLYELLECDGRTRGLFALNGAMPFRFGPRAAEIDLVCRSLTLAIEVDGYHHFTGPTAYRRDRRKDILLQTEGFWIIRFLADDVLERGSELVREVAELVARRRDERKEPP